jgi:hypothetical protein
VHNAYIINYLVLTSYFLLWEESIYVRFQVLMVAFWDIALTTEIINISEMSVDFYKTTWYNVLEGCHLQKYVGMISDSFELK